MAKSLYSHQNTLCERRCLLIDHLIINLLTPPPPLPVLLICPSPRTGVCLVSSHILACHLVSPAWHHRGVGPIFSHIHIPLAYCSHCFCTVRPQHFFTSFFFSLLKRLACKCPPLLLIGGSSSCPIKCNLEAPSRAIRAASLPTSCNEAQHILESIAPLVSPNGTSLLSKKQCKWK